MWLNNVKTISRQSSNKNVREWRNYKSGIILAGNAQEKPQIAEIIEVGPGGNVDGKQITMIVKKGDKVVVNKYAGTEIKYEGQDLIIVKQSDILAIAE